MKFKTGKRQRQTLAIELRKTAVTPFVVYFVLPPYKSLGTSVALFMFCYIRSTCS